MSALFAARSVVAGYGPLEILHGVDVHVERGEWVALLGVAGAGKSTLLNAFAGLIAVRSGSVTLDGADMTQTPAELRVRRGIALVPQGRRLFAGMTVGENLVAGAHTRRSAELRAARDAVFELFPRLRERAGQIVGTLSGGEQQMCAIGRALMAEPRLLLIDELSLGLAPIAVEELLVALERIRAAGTSLLVVEQDVEAALRFAGRAYVLQLGSVVLSGPAAEVATAESFAASYMGL